MMDKRTAEALEASIKHWDENAKAELHSSVFTGPENCGLCLLFHPDYGNVNSCYRCPVCKHTGSVGCANTPYEDAEEAHYAWEKSKDAEQEEAKLAFRAAAIAERDFLISLREPVTEDADV